MSIAFWQRQRRTSLTGMLRAGRTRGRALAYTSKQMDWLPVAPLGTAMLHMFEELIFPGGFMAWYRGVSRWRRAGHGSLSGDY